MAPLEDGEKVSDKDYKMALDYAIFDTNIMLRKKNGPKCDPVKMQEAHVKHVWETRC